ncbi:MAG TPA: uridine kinase [Gammaproteobacteria bacterium]|nr:uridine kinase [Gammaproteobacteria bacterium]
MITKVIAITGASASGKTYLAKAFRQALAEHFSLGTIGLISEDSYYRKLDHLPMDERERVNYDHPDAFEHDLLVEHLEQLKLGRTAKIPSYDYAVHTRVRHCKIVEPPLILILEGMLLLYDRRLRDQIDLSVFVDTPLEVCLSRRVHRDVETRGRSSNAVVRQFEQTVKPMFYEFVEPTRAYANLILSGEGEVTDLVCELIEAMNLKDEGRPNEEQGRRC